ncbi:mannanase [soil metagenome]
MKIKYITFISVLTITTLLYSCKTTSSFVKVKDTKFVVKEKPYYYVGTNFWYGAYLGADADYGDRSRLIKELDQLQKVGVKNLRIAAASEESDFAYPLNPPFQYKNGNYNDTLLQGLDFLLSEMAKRDMRAILILNNYWEWTGGMSEYVAWATHETIPDPTRSKQYTWDNIMNFAARFYTIAEAQNRYRKYIEMLVKRVNLYTKKTYQKDATIMTWELANEPRPAKEGNAETNMQIFEKWVDETASFIHTIDPNHLVTTGSEGEKGTLNSWDYARRAHESKHIDYVTIHLWPKNWGWYKADNPGTMEPTKKNTANYIVAGIKIARQLNKPIILEEFGFMRDGEKYSPGTAVTARDEFYGFVFQLVQDSIKAGSPLAGSNFWGWGGLGRAQHADHQWVVGDKIYLGDPYSEPQGLNSVYDSDKSTLDIISKYAKELETLSSKGKNN